MAVAKEIMGGFWIDGSSLVPASKPFINNAISQKLQKNQFLVSPPLMISLQQKRVHVKTVVKDRPETAIFEDIIKEDLPETAIFEDIIKQANNTLPDKAVRAVVTVRNNLKNDLKETLVKLFDAYTGNIVMELISTELDRETNAPKRSKEVVLKNWSKKYVQAGRVLYTAEFTVDSNFGVPGAITVRSKHQKEFFLETVTIEGFDSGLVHFLCNSWVQPKKDLPVKRIFFSNMPYLPSDTPPGLRAFREKELRDLRGDGKGVRKLSDRIYDYDVYNDLGNPDKSYKLARPALGGETIPYPRRCRTGRLPTHTDMLSESRVERPLPMYVPRDERFEEPKQITFYSGRRKGVFHNLIPAIKARISADNHDFNVFSDIDVLYKKGSLLRAGLQEEILNKLPIPEVVSRMQEALETLLKYDTPKIVSKDKFAWLRDDEFGRQALSGVNPVSIERLRVFPPRSNLDPKIYGPLESALKEEHILPHLNGMSVQQALEENKLFMVDYHDIYLPFLEGINTIEGRKAYATRTIFFLNPEGTLKPIAIELSLPPAKRVVTPAVDATTNWVWQLAKAHVWVNDAGVHQLVHHWLRTHASMEPFILAAHRQMSAMHPIFMLLDPHMRYTLEINAVARQRLINAGGVIETCFTPGPYAMEISAAAYKNFYRFDKEGLPADLICRGIAEPDPAQPHGLKLLIEDYPYAQDGLLIWFAIEKWIRTYVNHYYPDSSIIRNDTELQAWYDEAINVGHCDLRHEDWWPTLANPDDLVSILTTIIWLTSAQHAALNFGQYPYGGYLPNRPPLMRKLIPEETDPVYAYFLDNPQKYFLSALPSLVLGTTFMAVIDTLSTHSPDEEYLGQRKHPLIWSGDAKMVRAFYEFSLEVRKIEEEIDRRNSDPSLKNRCGAGVLPYELLAPSSEAGVTCRGVPNSITI